MTNTTQLVQHIEPRAPAARLIATLWRRWKQQREDDATLQTLAELDVRTLKDIGIPQEFRSRAAALREARNERLSASLR